MSALVAMLLAAAAAVPAPAQRALHGALALPEARLVVASWEPSLPAGCAPERAEVGAAIRGSGRVAVRLFGEGCSGWGWAGVRVFAPALVVASKVEAGAALEAGVRLEEREIRPGHEPLASLPAGAVAARTLPAGRVLEARHVRVAGSAPGTNVRVVVRKGTLALEAPGRIVPCPGPRVCAQLQGGARVEGRLEGDRLYVEVP